jgi:hypothetical protein
MPPVRIPLLEPELEQMQSVLIIVFRESFLFLLLVWMGTSGLIDKTFESSERSEITGGNHLLYGFDDYARSRYFRNIYSNVRRDIIILFYLKIVLFS